MGLVLVVVVSLVGPGSHAPARSAEAVEPETPGAWQLARGQLDVPRAAHGAVRLDAPVCQTAARPNWCGRVLTVIGDTDQVAFENKTAEWYDPDTQLWTRTGDMRRARGNFFTTTPLGDGRILVAGGENKDLWEDATQRFEIFDPDAEDLETGRQGAWGERVAPPTVWLMGHSATRLDGPACRKAERASYCDKILFTAVYRGASRGYRSQFAMLYDVENDEWTDVAPMSQTRFMPTATLLDGPACSGDGAPDWCGKVLVVGGHRVGEYGELYDPETERWTSTSDFAVPLGIRIDDTSARAIYHATTLLPTGEVLLVGGQDHPESTQVYDPASNAWRRTGNLGVPRVERGIPPAITVLSGGNVLVVGGRTRGSAITEMIYLADSEVWDPHARATVDGEGVTGAWLRTHSLAVARANPSLTLLEDGRVLAAGGRGSDGLLDSAELFDASSVERPPAVVGLEPDRGPSTGGASVTVRGAGFDSVREVRFGDVPASSFLVDSDQTLRAVAPPHLVGTVTVTVTTAAGTSPAGTAADFVYFDPSGAWLRGPPMDVVRASHSATLLQDGRVLVVGSGSSATPGVAEVYNPADGSGGSWEATGPMTAPPRAGHAAVRLPDGKVLITGGYDGSSTVATAEVYDPASNSWSAAARMKTARVQHTATLLHSGHVLVAGGAEGPAELYDPTTGMWTRTGSMDQPRFRHTATLLDGPACRSGDAPPWCGQVLAVGGEGAGTERYDPETGQWHPAGDLDDERYWHTATLLDGPACQQDASPAWCGHVLVVGGATQLARATAELYDPASGDGAGAWAPAAYPTEGRYDHTATLLYDGRVLIAGGRDADGRALGTGELFDLAGAEHGAWTATALMTEPRKEHTATRLMDGRVLVTGYGSVELFDPGLDRPSSQAHGLSPVLGSTAGEEQVTITGLGLDVVTEVRFGDVPAETELAGDRELAVRTPPHPAGRVDVSLHTVDGVVPWTGPSIFGFGAGRWRPAGFLADCDSCQARQRHTATRLDDGRVLVSGGMTGVGGAGTPGLASAQLYDPDDRSWMAVPDMIVARRGHSATLLDDGRVLVVGGQDVSGAISAVEVFDPSGDGSGEWSLVAPMATPRYDHTATLLDDGRVLVVGGASIHEATRQVSVNSAEIFDPATDTWLPAAPMRGARHLHTATRLDDGRVLVTGGLVTAVDVMEAEPLTTAEVFEPEADTPAGRWDDAGEMAVERFAHTATLLTGPACAIPGAEVACGQVVVVGGSSGGPAGTLSVEVYDPDGASGAWVAGPSLPVARTGHTATLTDDGRILAAGGGSLFLAGALSPGQLAPAPTASTEVFDPGLGRWLPGHTMETARGGHSSTLLLDGSVLSVGGFSSSPPLVLAADAERYSPAALVTGVGPGWGPSLGGTWVTIDGVGFASVSEVRFGEVGVGCPGVSCRVVSDGRLEVRTPAAGGPGPVGVAVVNDGGTSATVWDVTDRFRYVDAPGAVGNLVAEAVGSSSLDLVWDAPADGVTAGFVATSFEVVVSSSPIVDVVGFEAATDLCGGMCTFPAALRLRKPVGGLAPATTYTFGVRAVNDRGLKGPISTVTATTLPSSTRGTGPGGTGGGVVPDDPAVGPGAVADLAGSAVGSRTVVLSWSVPSADGAAGGVPVGSFVVKQSASRIVGDAGFVAARSLCGGVCRFSPSRVGDRVELTVEGLEPGAAVWFAVAAVDGAGNRGPVSDPVRVVVPADAAAPGPVSDLAAVAISGSQVVLSWSAVADDGTVGPPVGRYEVVQWAGEDDAVGQGHALCDGGCRFAPTKLGERLELTVTDLVAGLGYRYAVAAVDAAGNRGGFSEAVSVTMPGPRDPRQVGDLQAVAVSPVQVRLTWSTAAELSGKPVAGYVVRQSTSPFGSRTPTDVGLALCGGVCWFPGVAVGEQVTLTVIDLQPGRTYHYRIAAIDEAGQPGPVSNPVSVTLPGVGRLAGADRAATAVAASQAMFAAGSAPAVVVARAEGFADALAGVPLAVAERGPLLLTATDRLDPRVADEIDRVLADTGTVIVLGGHAAISPTVDERLTAAGHDVVRIAGPTRFDTAVAIARHLGSPDRVLLASGTDFPDAAAAGAAAADVGGVVLLTNGDRGHPATSRYLDQHPGATWTAVGGPAAAAYRSATPVVGATRYHTAVALAEVVFDTPTVTGIATGATFADALTGGADIAARGGPMLLSTPDRLPDIVRDYLTRHADQLTTVTVYGGTAALTPTITDQTRHAIG